MVLNRRLLTKKKKIINKEQRKRVINKIRIGKIKVIKKILLKNIKLSENAENALILLNNWKEYVSQIDKIKKYNYICLIKRSRLISRIWSNIPSWILKFKDLLKNNTK